MSARPFKSPRYSIVLFGQRTSDLVDRNRLETGNIFEDGRIGLQVPVSVFFIHESGFVETLAAPGNPVVVHLHVRTLVGPFAGTNQQFRNIVEKVALRYVALRSGNPFADIVRCPRILFFERTALVVNHLQPLLDNINRPFRPVLQTVIDIEAVRRTIKILFL